jgi:FdhD protein
MRRPAQLRSILRVGSANSENRRKDALAVEAPLTLTAQGDVWLTTMRTPGHDRELIVGWLRHEGLVGDPAAEISRLTVCGRPDDENYGDTYELVPNAVMEERLRLRDPALLQRTQLTSCGLCGHQGIEELVRQVPKREPPMRPPPWTEAAVRLAFENGSRAAPLFAQTGATHAASVVNTRGEVLLTREDVGRHNAVDKVVGHLALAGDLPAPDDWALLVSSRASFEIVHKAACAGFTALLCLSAPTTLAVDLAARCDLLLAGFYRHDGFNLYNGCFTPPEE